MGTLTNVENKAKPVEIKDAFLQSKRFSTQTHMFQNELNEFKIEHFCFATDEKMKTPKVRCTRLTKRFVTAE